jgi:Na+-transporting NADH:ubiquinone oxidoreductase subunit B
MSLRTFLDSQAKHFEKGGNLEALYPLYEVIDTFIFTPADVTKGRTHVRDSLELKRLMITVFFAVLPAVIMAFYNTGLQANSVLAGMSNPQNLDWHYTIYRALGFGFTPNSIVANLVLGAIFFLPMYIVTVAVGGIWEAVFATVRGHEITEGFLVTSILLPLTLPATVPLWQVALGTSFGVVIGKEAFGGVGMNFLNPALVARAFLFFAYPGQMSGDLVWIAVDGHSGATALSVAASGGQAALAHTFSWWDAFWGTIPGSMGETSTFAILLGALFLIINGVGSWRIMISIILGAVVTTFILNAIGSTTNPMFGVSPWWHLVLGGFAFGTIFMATDPVSAAMTFTGQWIYGILIGFMVILVRVVNPAYPEGMMLAILFGNVFAPIIDWFVVQANVKRRELRNARG